MHGFCTIWKVSNNIYTLTRGKIKISDSLNLNVSLWWGCFQPFAGSKSTFFSEIFYLLIHTEVKNFVVNALHRWIMVHLWPFPGVKAPDSTWKKPTVKWIYGSKSPNEHQVSILLLADWKSLWLWSRKIAVFIIRITDSVLILTTASGENSFVMVASIVLGLMLNMEELMRSIVTQKVRYQRKKCCIFSHFSYNRLDNLLCNILMVFENHRMSRSTLRAKRVMFTFYIKNA